MPVWTLVGQDNHSQGMRNNSCLTLKLQQDLVGMSQAIGVAC